MAMKGKAPPAKPFQLYENEELVECPYNMAHQVTNLKMMNHLMKCRRNYQKAMENDGSMMVMLACKYNWVHQVPAPELLYHERNCADRYNIVPHLIEMTRAEREKAGVGPTKKYEIYLTSGVPSVGTDPDEAATKKRSRGARGKDSISSTPGQNNTIRSFYASSSAGDGSIDKSKSSQPVVDPLKVYPEKVANEVFTTTAEEDWEVDCANRGYQGYDPSRKLENDLILKYPPNLTKSERRAWKEANMAKARRMFGDVMYQQEQLNDVDRDTNEFFRPAAADDEGLEIASITTNLSSMGSASALDTEDGSSSLDSSFMPRQVGNAVSVSDRYKDMLDKSIRRGREEVRKKELGESSAARRNHYFDDNDDDDGHEIPNFYKREERK